MNRTEVSGENLALKRRHPASTPPPPPSPSPSLLSPSPLSPQLSSTFSFHRAALPRGEKCCLKNLAVIKKKKRIKKSARHRGLPSPAECENTPYGYTVFIYGALALSCQPKHEEKPEDRKDWRGVCHPKRY